MSEWIKCSERLPALRDDSGLVFSLTGGGQYGFPIGGYYMVHIEDYFRDVGDGLDSEGISYTQKCTYQQGSLTGCHIQIDQPSEPLPAAHSLSAHRDKRPLSTLML